MFQCKISGLQILCVQKKKEAPEKYDTWEIVRGFILLNSMVAMDGHSAGLNSAEFSENSIGIQRWPNMGTNQVEDFPASRK